MRLKILFFTLFFLPLFAVSEVCPTLNNDKSKCEKDEDCTIVNNACNWPRDAVNKKFADELLKWNQCVGRGPRMQTQCELYNHVRDGKWNARCSAKMCIAVKEPTDPKIVCEKAGGVWDTFVGRGHVTGCNLPTKDAGKKCERGEDCESVCLKNRTCYGFKEYRGCAFFKGHSEIYCRE